jgi:hypothetical protein
MVKNQLVVLLSIFLLCLFSCGETDAVKLEKLHTEIMVVHDEVMPKMSELNRMKRQLNAFKNVVSSENAALKDSLITGILLISKSEDLMTDWMKNYDYPNEKIAAPQMSQYLIAQKDSIKNIGEGISMSLAIAQGFLKNAPDSIKNGSVKKKP